MENKFKVVFTGQLKPGVDPGAVIERLGVLFKMDAAKAQRLLQSGKAVTLKKGLDAALAEKVGKKLESIGMRVRVEYMDAEQPPAQPSPHPTSPPSPQPSPQPSLAPMEETEMHRAQSAPGGASEPAAGVCPKCGSKNVLDDTCQDCGIIVSKYRQVMQEREADDDDPYAAPQADLEEESDIGEMTGPVGVPAGHGWTWLADGFGYFKRNPWAWIGAFLLWIGINVVGQFIPLIGPLALNLISAVFLAGFMLGTHEQELNGDFQVGHLFAGFSSSNLMQLLLLGVFYLVILIVVVGIIGLVAGASMFMMMDPEALEQNPEMAAQMMGDPAGIGLAVLLGMALMIPVMMAWFFAPTLVAIEGLSAIQAMKQSFMGCLKNILPFLLYGLIAGVLMVLGMLPLGLGLLVVAPMFTASIYAAYRDIYYD